MLFKLTCRLCCPRMAEKRDDMLYSLDSTMVDISKLTPDCVFCDIIRQCCDHSVDNGDPLTWCKVVYGQNGFDVQLCLRREDGFCFYHHLHLYSDGMSVRSALFIY
jgi:hypothetical protein